MKSGVSNEDLKRMGEVLNRGRGRFEPGLRHEHGRQDRGQRQGGENVFVSSEIDARADELAKQINDAGG
jgi:hypothetical protein